MYTLEQGAVGFLRSKRKRLAESSYTEYERVMEKVIDDLGGDTDVKDLEPPGGTEIVEEFLDSRWGTSPHAYNRNLSVVRGLVRFLMERGHLDRDPCLPIERSRPGSHARTTFDDEVVRKILDAADNPRDRVALRLLLVYGLRKGALTGLQMVCFDKVRRMISFRTKGRKYHAIPIVGESIWNDVEEIDGHPGDFLLHRRDDPPKPMSPHGVHLWWYARLADAGIVDPGTTSGQRMHKARHTAGQRVLDSTGNLKAAQRLLGHASIQTTGDVYADWDADALRETMRGVDVVNNDD
jgi:integrase